MTREDELFRRLRGGDGAALEELIIDAYPAILRYCLWHTPDRQTAEDAAQETFLKAVRHLDAYVDPSNGRRYYSIVDCERLGTIRELQPQAGGAESADSGAPPPAQNHRTPQEQAQAGD